MALSRAVQKFLTRKLVEAMDAGDVGHNDLKKWLSDAVREIAEPGEYCYLVDFVGDGESGDVYYCCCDDLMCAPYEIKRVNGKLAVGIDVESAMDTMMRTMYEPEASDDDHYLAMQESGLYTKGNVPLCERFISTDARDKADGGSFAGKNKSFPILKKADVMAAVRSLGRAGPENYPKPTIKANIIRIAKAKGFGSGLPKAWQKDEDAKESAVVEAGARHSADDRKTIQEVHNHSVRLGAECGESSSPAKDLLKIITGESAELPSEGFRLIECAEAAEAIVLQESRNEFPIKLIAPGKGSSAFYTPEVLKRDGPAVFPAQTKIFLNHATAAEEAQRPEGDVNNLAGVTTAAATWQEGPKGPGLYATAKFFSDHAQTVEEKAPFVGMSIRGYGDIETVNGKPVMREGVPLLKRLTAARSVDVVTEAGAGGMILTESAAAPVQQQEVQITEGAVPMDAAELKALQESNAALLSEMKKIRERQSLEEAVTHVGAYFQTVQVSPAIQEQVTRQLKERFMLTGGMPRTESGEPDAARIKALTESETNEAIGFLKRMNPQLVSGMGSGNGAPLTEAQRKEMADRKKEQSETTSRRFASHMGFADASEHAKRILKEGRRAFDVHYNARNHGAAKDSGGTLPMVGGIS